jgi:O-antigen/teichoic acid export membrane protein
MHLSQTLRLRNSFEKKMKTYPPDSSVELTGNLEALARGTTINLSSRLGGRALGILGQILVARFLGPVYFGLYSIGVTMLSMGSVSLHLGLDRGIIRFGGQEWPQNPKRFGSYLLQSFVCVASVSLLLSALLFILAPWIANDVFENGELVIVLRLISPAFVFLPVIRLLAAATRVTKRMKFGTLSEDIIPPLAFVLFLIPLYALGFGLEGAIIALSISNFLGVVIVATFTLQLFPPSQYGSALRFNHVPELLKFSIPVSLAGMFSIFIVWINRLLVGYFRPEEEVGFYQASSQVSLLFAIILSATASIFTPLIVDLFKKGKSESIDELYKVSTKWGLYLSIPVFLVIALAPREIMSIVFGTEYLAGSQILVILATGQLINVATGSSGQILIMTGNHLVWMRLSLTMLLLSIFLNILLTPSIGMNGSAIATTIGIGGLHIFGLLTTRKRLRMWPYDIRYTKGFIAALVTLIILFIYRKILPQESIINLLGLAMISSTVMVVSLLVLRLDQEDITFFRALTRLFQKSIRGHNKNE